MDVHRMVFKGFNREGSVERRLQAMPAPTSIWSAKPTSGKVRLDVRFGSVADVSAPTALVSTVKAR
jgi:hypothetical protein